MTVFLLGLLWFFLISMQTRIVAFASNYILHAGWTFMVSMVWVYLIKQISFSTSHTDFVLYSGGTALGSILATYIHSKLKKNNETKTKEEL